VRAGKGAARRDGRDDFCCTLIGGGPSPAFGGRPSAAAEGVGRSVPFRRNSSATTKYPDPVLGRRRGRPTAEKRLFRPQHDEQDPRIHVLRPAIVAFDLKEARVSAEEAGLFVGGPTTCMRWRGGIRRAARRPGSAPRDGRIRQGAPAWGGRLPTTRSPTLLGVIDAARACRRRRGPYRPLRLQRRLGRLDGWRSPHRR